MLDAGQPVLALGWDVGRFEITPMGWMVFFAFGGDHDLLNDIVGVGGGGDHHDFDTALGDGLDD